MYSKEPNTFIEDPSKMKTTTKCTSILRLLEQDEILKISRVKAINNMLEINS